jgi:hypothetical protein
MRQVVSSQLRKQKPAFNRARAHDRGVKVNARLSTLVSGLTSGRSLFLQCAWTLVATLHHFPPLGRSPETASPLLLMNEEAS